MSNQILTAVFQRSRSEGLARIVLLSIADRADDQGRTFCGVTDICKRANATRRGVFYALQELRELGEIAVLDAKGPRGCNRYQITLDQCKDFTSATPSLVQMTAPSGERIAPIPLLTPNNSTIKKPRATKEPDQDFEIFWKTYPRRVAKGAARKAWVKTNGDRPPLPELLAAITTQTAAWNDPKFIPHPGSWLNGHRWADEPPEQPRKPQSVLGEAPRRIVL